MLIILIHQNTCLALCSTLLYYSKTLTTRIFSAQYNFYMTFWAYELCNWTPVSMNIFSFKFVVLLLKFQIYKLICDH